MSLGARGGSEALADPTIGSSVDSALWQGLPGARATIGGFGHTGGAGRTGESAPADRCLVSSVNPDDPVAELTWQLLRDPRRAARVLAALPGSDSATPGAGHRYRPVLPPSGCVLP